ncbi:MAG: hypothetical protein WDN26_18730 [Chitinophagaceae bacterium]
MEDIKFSGGIRIASNLRDNDVLFEFTTYGSAWTWVLLISAAVMKLVFLIHLMRERNFQTIISFALSILLTG